MKVLNENLQKVIRVLKDSDKTLDDVTNKQLSQLSNVSSKYITRNKKDIENYYITAPNASKQDWNYAANRSLIVYFDIASNMNSKFIFRNIMGAIAGWLLKWEYKLLHHVNKNNKIIEIGISVIEIICLINSRKETNKGTPIHSQSKAVKQLFRGNKVGFIDELFKRTDGYYAGNSAKKWFLSSLSNELLHTVINKVFEYLHLCPHFGTTYSSKCSSKTQTNLITLNLDIVKSLSLTSILHILNMTVGYNKSNEQIIVSTDHTSLTDCTIGRNYNVFCKLRSEERLKLGYISYDINSALQTICLQLIEASENDYPILTSYSHNKDFKQSLRASIANDLNIPISDVKAKLTAFANGGISGKDKHPMYIKFQEESDRLRREVLSYTAKHKPWLLEQSINQSKRDLPEDIDWFSLEPEDNQTMARNKSSVFFFIWTYYEMLIRKSMLEILVDGIEVHDAVYSKMKINVNSLEKHILDETELLVIIDF